MKTMNRKAAPRVQKDRRRTDHLQPQSLDVTWITGLKTRIAAIVINRITHIILLERFGNTV